jgi:uncharacterized lipoprotein YddW (UPF0748 family)
MRSVWLTTVLGLDWPKSSVQSEQKSSLINIFQNMKNANMNAAFFQVRSRGDLMYPSQYEPWAASLSGGILGLDPGYDPLQFAIEEAHKRGMELHAWWNACIALVGTVPPYSHGLPHVAVVHPEWVKIYKPNNELWFDPGLPEVREYLVKLAMEMIRKYDIDGIHFDYIRYPNPDFNDDSSYAIYGGGVNRSDWRRENINKFVRALYDSAMKVKPMLKVGTAAIGIYKSIPGASGWQGYSDVFQDSRRWLQEGKHDYVAPMIYWTIGSSADFAKLVYDWQQNSYGKHVYAGVAAYKADVLSQIQKQIDTTRSAQASGNVYFRYDHISDTRVFGNKYGYPANVPHMWWKDNLPPNPPTDLKITKLDETHYRLDWTKPTSASDGDTARYYNIYRSTTSPVNFNSAANLLYITTNSQATFTDGFSSPPTQNYYYIVSALDKGNVESYPSNQVANAITSVAENNVRPDRFWLEQNYPNPFNPNTTISFTIQTEARTTLKVFDVLGREVATMVDANLSAGSYSLDFDGTHLPSGTYFYRLSYSPKVTAQAGQLLTYVAVKKMILSK